MNTKGIGLGLVISEQICKQFNGDIHLESEIEKGSTFTFKIMLEEEIQKFEDEKLFNDNKFNINSNKLEFKWQPNQLENSKEIVEEIKYVYEIEDNLSLLDISESIEAYVQTEHELSIQGDSKTNLSAISKMNFSAIQEE